MDWSKIDMTRLYELYRQHFDRLRTDVIQVNRSLGSMEPEKTWMELLSSMEFMTLITTSTDEPKMVQRWLRCIIRGHEHEFPELQAA